MQFPQFVKFLCLTLAFYIFFIKNILFCGTKTMEYLSNNNRTYFSYKGGNNFDTIKTKGYTSQL
ncbi:hypothetical protein SAMN02194393_00638 [Maledivibacter halophilus]|uniref:Uncharacterized protein n=1 Tax=Maledivibacter halophilus TaxID=36842 RepID=A0A1T5IQN0_9FIRM|nr:hypothetical protein SAMN02194393_00638 [Maledivibacter halophilus]